jgi:hypothetical protein
MPAHRLSSPRNPWAVPLDFLLGVMTDQSHPIATRVDAARAAPTLPISNRPGVLHFESELRGGKSLLVFGRGGSLEKARPHLEHGAVALSGSEPAFASAILLTAFGVSFDRYVCLVRFCARCRGLGRAGRRRCLEHALVSPWTLCRGFVGRIDAATGCRYRPLLCGISVRGQ